MTGWQPDTKQSVWTRKLDLAGQEVITSTNYTATGQTSAVTLVTPASQIAMFLDVTVVAGTGPLLDVTVQWSPDEGSTWFDADPPDSFTQIIAVGPVVKLFDVKAPDYRLDLLLWGVSPEFTFKVSHVGI